MQNNERSKTFRRDGSNRSGRICRSGNNLTPDQKNALRERAQRWQQLSPEDRSKVRNELLPKWQQMTRSGAKP